MPSPGGIRRDQPAVANGRTLVYSSGTAEDTIRRVRALKRQMSGRADLDLLRKRILLST
jgi:transposase